MAGSAADPRAQLDWERLATNLRVEQALLEALALLDGIPVAVFKGGILTRRIYGDLSRRASSDNDLAVRRADGRRALERLLAAGYCAAPGLDPERALVRTGQVSLLPNGDPEQPAIDLHIEPFSGNFFTVEEAVIWSHLERMEVHGREVLTFDVPLALCHMTAHFLQHLLEVEQLPHLGRAWDAFAVSPSILQPLAARTCSVEALEYALGLAAQLGHLAAPPPPVTTARARWALRYAGASFLATEPGATVRGLVAVLLAGPGRLPRALLRGFFPESDELTALYGPMSARRALWKHWQHRVLEGLVKRGS